MARRRLLWHGSRSASRPSPEHSRPERADGVHAGCFSPHLTLRFRQVQSDVSLGLTFAARYSTRHTSPDGCQENFGGKGSPPRSLKEKLLLKLSRIKGFPDTVRGTSRIFLFRRPADPKSLCSPGFPRAGSAPTLRVGVVCTKCQLKKKKVKIRFKTRVVYASIDDP